MSEGGASRDGMEAEFQLRHLRRRPNVAQLPDQRPQLVAAIHSLHHTDTTTATCTLAYLSGMSCGVMMRRPMRRGLMS